MRFVFLHSVYFLHKLGLSFLVLSDFQIFLYSGVKVKPERTGTPLWGREI